MKSIFLILIAVVLLGVGFLSGVLFQRAIPIDSLLLRFGVWQPFNTPGSESPPLQDGSLPDLSDNASAFVGLVLGQSNAGSHGILPPDQILPDNAYQFWEGDLYTVQDPLFGSSGRGGSIWTALTPDLLNDYPAVVWATTVVGNTALSEWLPGGQLNQHLNNTLTSIEKASMPVDAIFWIQGESDAFNKVADDEFYDLLVELISILEKSLGQVPLYLAKATRCYERAPYPPVRTAVDRAVVDFDHVQAGIDLDSFDLTKRFDGCHLLVEGQQLAAQQWYKLLKP